MIGQASERLGEQSFSSLGEVHFPVLHSKYDSPILLQWAYLKVRCVSAIN